MNMGPNLFLKIIFLALGIKERDLTYEKLARHAGFSKQFHLSAGTTNEN